MEINQPLPVFVCMNCNETRVFNPKNRKGKFCSISCMNMYRWEINGRLKVVMGEGGDVKRYLSEEFGHKCSTCQGTEWLGKPIPLKLSYIDGNKKNKDLGNLKLECPNCLGSLLM